MPQFDELTIRSIIASELQREFPRAWRSMEQAYCMARFESASVYAIARRVKQKPITVRRWIEKARIVVEGEIRRRLANAVLVEHVNPAGGALQFGITIAHGHDAHTTVDSVQKKVVLITNEGNLLSFGV